MNFCDLCLSLPQVHQRLSVALFLWLYHLIYINHNRYRLKKEGKEWLTIRKPRDNAYIDIVDKVDWFH